MAGFLVSGGAWSGLAGPMLGHITLVWPKRCRPSPDPVSEAAR
ncbi:MAG: hypothetical protein ACXWZ2_05500 [Mycobacterium sp.]